MSKITDKEELMLVSDLYEELKDLMKNGRGNWKIKIGDRYLYKDEIAIDYMHEEIRLYGYLYHEHIFQPTVDLKANIKEAFDEWGRHR
jgi:hypothetical protein